MRSLGSELQTNPRADHCMTREVDVGIVIELPEPMRAIIVSSKADSPNVPDGVFVSRLEDTIERNDIASVQLAPPDKVSVLLPGVQTNVEDRVRLNPIVTAEFMGDSQLHRVAGIPEQIEEGFKVRSGISGKGSGLS